MSLVSDPLPGFSDAKRAWCVCPEVALWGRRGQSSVVTEHGGQCAKSQCCVLRPLFAPHMQVPLSIGKSAEFVN